MGSSVDSSAILTRILQSVKRPSSKCPSRALGSIAERREGGVASFGGLPFVAASMRAFRDVADSFAWLIFRAYIPTDDTAEHI